MLVKSRHKHLGLKIGHLPQRHDQVAGTRYFEGALQAVHPFVAYEVAEARFAGGEHHEFGVGEVHLADFVGGEDAVFQAGAQGFARFPGVIAARQHQAGADHGVVGYFEGFFTNGLPFTRLQLFWIGKEKAVGGHVQDARRGLPSPRALKDSSVASVPFFRVGAMPLLFRILAAALISTSVQRR